MKRNFTHARLVFLLGIAALCPKPMTAATATSWVTDDFISGTVWRATGYAGLGNQNEPLACGMLTVSSSNSRPTISYTLLGKAKDYVSRITIYARKYEKTSLNTTGSGSNYYFFKEFDYRDPQEKNGAVLLAQTTNLDATSLTSEETLAAGQYVIYVCGDIRQDVTLPYIGGGNHNYTKLGAKITAMSGINKTTEYSSYNNSSYSDGARVLIPSQKTLFAPGDYYSKYYRIPAAVRASDGSIVACSDARKEAICDIANNIDIVTRRSTDNGKTWSTPVTIAKGTSFTTGFGDPALAALPNGNIVCTFVHGYGLSTSNSSNRTDNYYSVSKDNGKTWSEPKLINVSAINNQRGCIAPGNMCVMSGGLLDGKVVGSFRSYQTQSGSATNYNFILVYDPATDTWSNLTNKYSAGRTENNRDYYKNTLSWDDGTDDESQVIQIADNKLLLSIRSTCSSQREFAILSLTQDNGTVKYTATNATNSGMQLTQPCNGTMVRTDVTTSSGTSNYLLHTVPASTVAEQEGGKTRANLKIFTTTTSSVGSTVNWDGSTNAFWLSDPYGYTSSSSPETAQYSSIIIQDDGTVGILYEGYPQAKRMRELKDGSAATDMLMRSQYVNLRMADIFPNAIEASSTQLDAPAITPGSVIYGVSGSERPNPVISQANETSGVTTCYTVLVYDANGKLVSTKDLSSTDSSIKLTWGEGALSGITPTAGYAVKVSAYCEASGYKTSSTTTETYYFKQAVRKLKIKAVPNETSGSPRLLANGVSAGKDETLTVGVGDKVQISGYANDPFTFEYFTTEADGSKQSLTGLNAEADNKLGYQYTITVPSESAVANNYNDELVIYANYASPTLGLMTRVETNFFNSADNTYEKDENGDDIMVRHYFNTTWSTNGNEEFPEEGSSYTFAEGKTSSHNTCTGLKYPTLKGKTYKVVGLDLTATVMADATTFDNYNAIVALYNATEERLVLQSELNAKGSKKAARRVQTTQSSDDSQAAYYVINGHSYPLASTSDVATSAMGVKEWYTTDGTSTPAKVTSLTFDQVLDKTSDSQPSLEVKIYVVSKNELTNVADLVNGKANYVFEVSHTIAPDGTMTGAPIVKAGDGVSIIGRQGEALLVAGSAAARIDVHNVVGLRMASVSLKAGESATVQLPQGVYVAAGQKFIVR